MEYGNMVAAEKETEPRLKGICQRLDKATAVFRQLNEDMENRLNSLIGSTPTDNNKSPEPPVNCALDELSRLVLSIENNLNSLERSNKRFREII